MIFIATISGLAAAVLWGLSDYYTARSSKVSNEYIANFAIQVGGFIVVVIPIVLIYGLNIASADVVLMSLAIATLFTIAYIAFVKAFSVGNVGVVAPLANSYALITLVVGILFFAAQLSALEVFFAVLIVFGVVMLSTEKTEAKTKLVKSKSVVLGLSAAIFWGIGFALLDTIVAKQEWYELLFLIGGAMVLLAGIAMLAKVRTVEKLKALSIKKAKSAYIAGLILSAGSVAFYMGIEATGSVIIPAVIASASPLVTSLAARIVDKEKLTTLQRVGAVVVVLGIAALNFVALR